MAGKAKKEVTVDLNSQAQEILKKAKDLGIENSFLFVTTFKRYMELIQRLDELQAAIKEEGTLVTKEYVKDRKNLYVNPAVNAYNSTAAAADKCAQTLLKIIGIAANEKGGDDEDEFGSF